MATTSRLKPTHGDRSSRIRTAWVQARAKRSWTTRTSSRLSPAASSSVSISATTTTIGRERSQPSDSACAAVRCASPARPARASRMNSARYLLSTVATACCLVTASAATVAARSSRWTSSAVRVRVDEKATSRPWSAVPATIRTMARRNQPSSRPPCGPGPPRLRTPTGSCSMTNRPVRSKHGWAVAAASSSEAPALARTRPSVVVTTAAPSSSPTSCSQRSARSPPVRTTWTSARCTSSARASSWACSP